MGQAGGFEYGYWLTYGFAVFAIPLTFRCTRKNKIDRYVGELSYPVYITHLLVIQVLTAVHVTHALPIIFATLLLSLAVMHCVIDPIDRIRERRVRALAAQTDLVTSEYADKGPA
jgi:peptidoglycan/LPS O-acetylase OafA/YrhL